MKKNIIITSAIIIVILITLVILGNNQNNKQISKEIRLNISKNEYKACIVKAWEVYNSTWENNCLVKGLGENCSLPMVNVNSIEKTFKDNKDNCLEIYKLELNAIK
jgi:hypothetical protein